MKFEEIKGSVGELPTKKLKELMRKISPAEFKKEMNKKNGSIINIIKRKLKQ